MSLFYAVQVFTLIMWVGLEVWELILALICSHGPVIKRGSITIHPHGKPQTHQVGLNETLTVKVPVITSKAAEHI